MSQHIVDCEHIGEKFEKDHSPQDDHRPRVVLVVGDGFSKSLRRHVNRDEVDFGKLFSPTREPFHYHAEGYPPVRTRKSGFGDFPSLQEAWESYEKRGSQFGGTSLHGFCLEFANDVPFHKSNRASGASFEMELKGMQYELRRYLWRLFRWHHDQIWDHQRPNMLLGWPWLSVLKYLATSTRLTAISYNYDHNLEYLFKVISKELHRPIEKCGEAYRNRPRRASVLLKPHGCIFHDTLRNVGGNCSSVYWHNSNGFATLSGPELQVCPLLPDLVPPGQSFGQFANPNSDVLEAAQLAIKEADVAIVCGFSARAPDHVEFRSLCGKPMPDRLAIHVGLDADRDTAAARILRDTCGEYAFCNAMIPATLSLLPSWISALDGESRALVREAVPDTTIWCPTWFPDLEQSLIYGQ